MEEETFKKIQKLYNVSVMREKTQNKRVGYSATYPMGRDMLRSEGVMELGGRGEGERRR